MLIAAGVVQAIIRLLRLGRIRSSSAILSLISTVLANLARFPGVTEVLGRCGGIAVLLRTLQELGVSKRVSPCGMEAWMVDYFCGVLSKVLATAIRTEPPVLAWVAEIEAAFGPESAPCSGPCTARKTNTGAQLLMRYGPGSCHANEKAEKGVKALIAALQAVRYMVSETS